MVRITKEGGHIFAAEIMDDISIYAEAHATEFAKFVASNSNLNPKHDGLQKVMLCEKKGGRKNVQSSK